MSLGRRLIGGVLALLLITAGIAWSQFRATEVVSILMAAPFADATAPLVERFNQEHRGRIRLSITRGPRDTESISDLAISSLLLGKPPYDALLMDVTWLPKYAEAGWLEPLDPWFSATDQEALQDGARLGNSYQGSLYRWPLVADVGMLYWRTDLMASPPASPEDLVRISREIQAAGKTAYGFVWQGRQYEGLSCDFLEVLEGFGGTWLDPSTGQPNLDSSHAIEAANWFRSLIDSDISPKAVTNFAEPESLQAFKAGDAAFMRNWPYAYAELQKPDSAVRGNVAVTTMVSQNGEQPTATLGSWGLSLLSESPHQESAVKAIRYLTSEAAQRERFLKQGYTPTSAELFSDPELVAVSPVLPDVGRALSVAVARPPSPLYAQLSDVVQRSLSSVLTGEQSAEIAMEAAQQNSRVILQSAGGPA